MYTNLLVAIYQFDVKPIAGKWENRITNFNVVSIILIGFHMVSYTDNSPDKNF